MAKLSKNKKYVTLDAMRVSYKKADDSIHLVSSDEEFPLGFHMPLQKGTFVEDQARELLKEHGIITSDAISHPALPKVAAWSEKYYTSKDFSLGFFPMGVTDVGGVEFSNPYTAEKEHVVGIDFWGEQAALSKSLGKPLDPSIVTTPHLLVGGGTGSGKSVIIRNLISGVLLRPDHWDLLAIDLTKVELSMWKQYPNVTVATTMEESLDLLRSVKKTIQERYSILEEKGANNFRDLQYTDTPMKAILIVADEISYLLRQDNSMRSADHTAMSQQASRIIYEISRLGRAAGVHLVLSSQMSAFNLLSSDALVNFGGRVVVGRVPATISQQLLKSDSGTKVRTDPRGRMIVKVYGEEKMCQSFFATSEDVVKSINYLHLMRTGEK